MKNVSPEKIPTRRWGKIKLSRRIQFRLFLAVSLLSMVQGLTMTGLGVLWRFQMGNWLKRQVLADPVGRLYTPFFKLDRASSEAPLRLLSENIGNTLLYMGLVVVLVSDIGLGGALFLRPLLVLFMLMMTMIILTEVVCVTIVLNGGSSMNLEAREAALMTLDDQSGLTDGQKMDSSWLNGLHLLMIKLDCCGLTGPGDFKELYSNDHVPQTCCRGEVLQDAALRKQQQCLDGTHSAATAAGTEVRDQEIRQCQEVTLQHADLTDCTWKKPFSPSSVQFQKTKGCYKAIFDGVRASLGWLIPIIAFLLLSQVSMVVGSMHVFNKRLTFNKPPSPCQPV